MHTPVITILIKRRNFKTNPFHIYINTDGWPVATVWSRIARLRHYPNGEWVLRDGNLDFHIHADQLIFDEETQ